MEFHKKQDTGGTVKIIKLGTRVKILEIGPRDHFKNHSKDLIGANGIVIVDDLRERPDGYFTGQIRIPQPNDNARTPFFLQVRVRNLGGRRKKNG